MWSGFGELDRHAETAETNFLTAENSRLLHPPRKVVARAQKPHLEQESSAPKVLQPYCNQAGTHWYATDELHTDEITTCRKICFLQVFCGQAGTRWNTLVHTGAVAQLGERCLCTAEVRGSNPLGSTLLFGNHGGGGSGSLIALV